MTNDGRRAPAVLIVGAGAMGLVTGYHLRLAGALVTFLVRPARVPELRRPLVLYSYDDASLKTLSDYQVISNAVHIASSEYEFVIITLDGASTRTPDGTALLGSIGESIRNSPAVVIIGGVGIGLRDHYLLTMNLPAHRILNGGLGLLCHQVAPTRFPVHTPTLSEMLTKADVAYRHVNKNGFLLDDSFPEAGRAFATLYDACGVSRCAILKKPVFAMLMKLMFPIFSASELLGWPYAEELGKDRSTWPITVRAIKEIMGFREHGWIGKVGQLFLTKGMLLKLWKSLEKSTLPLDFPAFNRFHHGGKVRSQDLQLLRACADEGERQGLSMRSLRELLSKVEALH